MKKPELLLVGPMMPHVMAAMESDYIVHRLWEAEDREETLDRVAGQIRAIGTGGRSGADAALMDRLPNLEIIASFGVGVDTIDVEHAHDRGIIVTNTPDVLNDEVANMALALLLATTRRLVAGDRFVREGKWRDGPMPLEHGLRGTRLGILGLGRIGKDFARKAGLFGMEIVYNGRREQPDQPYRFMPDLVEMAAACDHLVVLCPGGPSTDNLVGRAVLDALGPEGTLINVARGTVVDEPELVAALVEKRLGAAGLDVFADEPHVPEALLALDNVVLQPHKASATIETRHAMGDLVIENLRAHFAGRRAVTPV
ncbi:2-hydroxyacid dehydrogenase [Oceanibacterium hippocampi]|uniref:Glyoxylate/hydroxypyruvate reductase B n=1 Tax=Oceanibacterium hippocampi TaxID=745714 RepID=A0A1Y5T9Z6_9PROT|nr:2-hydroxyacid dehydrogenase [Oceanibacterium hippocampi]SLN58887.1 Glyoxylate/hydroxypyruvate reductase B [Oceanibacterium hippocampi]